MKICWDNLEKIFLSKNGNFRKSSALYVEMEACKTCGEPYLTTKSDPSKFCSVSCAIGGKNHYLYGKTHSTKTKKKMSKAHSGKNNGMYGKTHTIGTKKKLSAMNVGKTISVKIRKKISKSLSGSLHPNYKGGLSEYERYKDTLGIYEEVRKQEGTNALEVKCTYCGRWFAPTYCETRNRINAMNRLNQGECRLYCSTNCKLACPTYGQKMYPKGFKHTSSREVSTYLRQIVLERDNWTCQICGKTILEAQLHVHHMDPVAQNPMFQNDMDSCVTLCKDCHKMVHSRIGCRYVDLRCKNKNKFNDINVILKI
jgi:5-methylcytosine-specific restriction endonuclease McrA